jgi:hypothetical protein
MKSFMLLTSVKCKHKLAPRNPNAKFGEDFPRICYVSSDDGTFYDIVLSHVPFAVVFSWFRRKQLYMFLTKGRRQWEWRCRAKLAVRGTSMDAQIGLFEEGSHFVVDIPSCRGGLLSITAG